jgi:hypothetical protein
VPDMYVCRDCGAHRLSLVEAFKKKDKLMQLMQGPDTETLTPGTVSRQRCCTCIPSPSITCDCVRANAHACWCGEQTSYRL